MPGIGSHAHTRPVTLRPQDDDDLGVDDSVSCDSCDAVCCRLTVVVMPEDQVPRHMVERSELGLEVMAHGEDGWCVAVDQARAAIGVQIGNELLKEGVIAAVSAIEKYPRLRGGVILHSPIAVEMIFA